MPSVRHAVVAAYIRAFVRRRYIDDDDVYASHLLERRGMERPHPPRSIRSRVTTDRTHGFEVHTLAPRVRSGDLRLVYLHGGSYVSDLTPQHWHLISYLSDKTGATVVVPRYPLAPEATWRTSRAALVRIAGNPSRRTVLIGDSSGGGLALAIAQRLVADGAPPAGVVLIAPWVDLAIDPMYGTVPDDPWLDRRIGHSSGRLWAGGDDFAHPELSPLHGEMAGLPSTLVISGSRDILHPGSLELIRRLEAAHVDAGLEVGEGMIHAYPILPVPEARPARATITRFVTSLLTSNTMR